MARNMLKTKKMPKEFWAEAVDCAIYLSNRCPTKSLNGMTPQEAWSRRKPSVSHLKVFGSIGYVHVDDQVRTKLDDKSKMMIFVGYDQKSKGYKFYNPIEGKMVISGEVEFNEEGAWDWKVNNGEKYDFLSIIDEEEERYEDHQKPIVTPPQTPMSSTSSSSSNEISSNGTPPSSPRKIKSLDDLYEVTNHIDDITLYFHLATCDTIVFEEAIKDAKWRIAIDEEIASIEKNDI